MKKQILRRMISLVTALLIAVGCVYGPAAGAATTEGIGESDVVILSFNVLTTSKQDITATDPDSSETRGQKLIGLVQDNLPDSMGLCEVTTTWLDYLNSDVVTADYGSGATYALTGTTSCSGSKLASGSGEYSPILYRSDKYELVEEGGYWFSDTPDSASKYGDILDADGNVKYTGMKFNRVYAYAVLRDKFSQEVYIHINAHFDHVSADYINVICAKQLIAGAKELSQKYGGCPVVMTGDYNATEDTEAWAHLANGENGFVDAKYLTDVRSYESSCAGYGTSYNAAATSVIDHVFVSNGNVGAYEHDIIVDPYASDHACVYAKLALHDLPVIGAASISGTSVTSFSSTDYSYDVTVAEETVTLQLKVDETYSVYLNGDLQTASDAEYNYQLPLTLADGDNQYKVCVANTDGVRTEYTFDIYKNYGEVNLLISEINPSAASGYQYFSVTNLGTWTVDIEDYEFLWGNIARDGAVTWEYAFQISENNKKTEIGAGETVVFWITADGDPETFNEYYGTWLSADEIVTSNIETAWSTGSGDAGNMTTNRNRGMRIAKATDKDGTPYGWTNVSSGKQKFQGETVSVSSYAGISSENLSNGQHFKFGYVSGEICTTASDVEAAEYATPDVYDKYVGINYRDAYSNIEAEEMENGSGLNVEGTWLANTIADSWAFFYGVDFGDVGAVEATFYGAVRSSNAAGTIEIYIDGTKDGNLSGATLIGTCTTSGTVDNWTQYEEFTCKLDQLVTGVHNVTLKMVPTKTYVINLDHFRFVEFTKGTEISSVDSLTFELDGEDITTESKTVTASHHASSYTLTTDVQYSPSDAAISIAYLSSDSSVAAIDRNTGNITCLDSGDVTFTAVVYSNLIEFARYESAPVSFVYSDDAFSYIEAEWAADITAGTDKSGNTAYAASKKASGASGMSDYLSNAGYNYLGNTVNGSTATYENVNFGNGGYTSLVFNMAVKTSNCSGTVNVYLKNADGTKGSQIGYCTITEGTDGGANNYNTYKELQGVITDSSVVGIHDVLLEFVVDSGMSYVGNIDYFRFTSPDSLVQEVEDLIEAIGEVTLESEEAINAAREAYDALTEEQKALVSNYDILVEAEKTLAELLAAVEPVILDAYAYIEAELATDFTNGTNNKGESVPSKAAKYSGATGMSDYVSEDGNNYLSNTVNGSTVTYENVNFGDGGLSGVVFNMALRTGRCSGTVEIYLKNEDGTVGRQIGYCSATEGTDDGEGHYRTYKEFQGVITDTSITDIHDVLLKFVVDDGNYYVANIDYFYFTKADNAVAAVEALIDAIGEVTLESEEAITAAREAYDALTEEQEALVGNYDTLVAAEKTLAELQAAAEKATADQAAADAVEALIDAIGEVTLESREAITAAREAYDALTEEQKALVSNLDILTDAQKSYAELMRDPESPETGDTHLIVWSILWLCSAAVLAALWMIRTKHNYR